MLIPVPTLPRTEENVPSFMLDTKRRRDNVHDFVYLNDIERAVIDTPEMQRLRYIKQLGFAHLVYESAEHSRFAHSIGVCHTAKLLADCLNRNHAIASAAVPDVELPDPARPLLRQQPNSSPVGWARRVCIGLAALLHDLPHPPMSHALENESAVLIKHDDVSKNPQLYRYLFGEDSQIAVVLRSFSDDFKIYVLKQKDALGINERMVDEFLDRNELSQDQFLAGIVFEILGFKALEKHPWGTFEYRRSWSETSRPFHFSGFFRPFSADVISNTICADLIDYLLRDALNTGVQKSIDLKFLDRMYVKGRPGQPENERRVVFDLCDRRGGLRKDTVSDLLCLLESRYTMMERVYMHRTKLAASAMLGRAYVLVQQGGDGFNDEFLYEPEGAPSDDSLLRKLLSAKIAGARMLARKLLERSLYRPLFVVDEEVCHRSSVPLDKAKLVSKYRQRPLADEEGSKRWAELVALERKLGDLLMGGDSQAEYPIIVFCMDEQVAYKDPRVLVEIPRSQDSEGTAAKPRDRRLKAIENTRGMLQLLRNFTSDHGVQSQITSMLTNYNTLWKLYIFADHGIATRFAANVPAVYAALVESLEVQYPVAGFWRELKVATGDYLEDRHLDTAVKAHGASISSTSGEAGELIKYLSNALDANEETWKRDLRDDNIPESRFPALLQAIKIEYEAKFPPMGPSLTKAQRTEHRAWLRARLRELNAKIAEEESKR